MIRILLLTLLALLAGAGCVVQNTEVVRIRHADGSLPAAPGSVAADHVVARGETLYSIAFRSQLDWRQVAAWNALSAPYTIYPGQRLRLAPAGAGSVAAADPGPATAPGAQGGAVTRPVLDEGVTSPAPSSRTPAVVAAPPAAAPPAGSPGTASQVPISATTSPPAASTPPAVAVSTVPATPVPTAPAPSPVAGPASAPAASPAGSRSVGGVDWRWPTQGEVIRNYRADDLSRQGIGIAGSSGQAVVAAADGQVVYSGSGLRGYGELIIIKHSAEYLSAYGHNRRRLVNEGEQVRAGQPIAELGRTGADRDMLHFEIRRGGNPVDPAGFLPRR